MLFSTNRERKYFKREIDITIRYFKLIDLNVVIKSTSLSRVQFSRKVSTKLTGMTVWTHDYDASRFVILVNIFN